MRKTKKQILEGLNLEDIAKNKVIANNTLEIYYRNGDRAIRLHNTNIVTYKANGNVIFNSGGWKTTTTKDRIRRFSPFHLIQNNYIWNISPTFIGKGYTFYDGITFDKNGKLLTENKQADIKGINKIKKDIKKYVSLIDKLEKLPIPKNGDCLYCFLRGKTTGETFGDLTNSEHLEQHIKEGYIFGSILVNAMREYGYNDMKIPFHYQIDNRDTFKRALRKYLYKRLTK